MKGSCMQKARANKIKAGQAPEVYGFSVEYLEWLWKLECLHCCECGTSGLEELHAHYASRSDKNEGRGRGDEYE